MNILSIICGVVGPMQIVIILAIIVLLFGGKKIPELMKGLGKGIKEFKDGMNKDAEEKDKKNP
jgi:sec-independent protein translocase protein TatA